MALAGTAGRILVTTEGARKRRRLVHKRRYIHNEEISEDDEDDARSVCHINHPQHPAYVREKVMLSKAQRSLREAVFSSEGPRLSNEEPAKISRNRRSRSHTKSGISGVSKPSKPSKPAEIDDIIQLDIGGTVFTHRRSLIIKYAASSRLGKVAILDPETALKQGLCDGYSKSRQEYYFDRSALIFESSVAQFFRTGKLHGPDSECFDEYMTELHYWKIRPTKRQACVRCGTVCQQILSPEPVMLEKKTHDKMVEMMAAMGQQGSDTPMIHIRYIRAKRIVWEFMDDPGSSLPAKIFCLITVAFIVLTVLNTILLSLPGEPWHSPVCRNVTKRVAVANTSGIEVGFETETVCYEDDSIVIQALSVCCIIWFTFDYILRFWSSADPYEQATSPMSIIDLLSILPFFFELGLELGGITAASGNASSIRATRIVRILRVFRVLRVMKLARYSFGMKMMAICLARSMSELMLVVFYTLLCSLIASTILYYVEGSEPGSYFNTIPAGIWWSVVTLLNYADAPPVSALGKVITACTTIVGVILLAFPITIVVDKFGRVYDELRAEDPSFKRDDDFNEAGGVEVAIL